MALLAGIRIDSYRCFEALTVDGFSRINVIVGANNSGKTALLEAVELVATQCSPKRLWRCLFRRGQYFVNDGGESGSDEQPEALLDARELRHGRRPFQGTDESIFKLFASGELKPTVEVTS